jgi:hypothetical protein
VEEESSEKKCDKPTKQKAKPPAVSWEGGEEIAERSEGGRGRMGRGEGCQGEVEERGGGEEDPGGDLDMSREGED